MRIPFLDQSIAMLSKKLPVADRKLSGFERYKDPLKENVVGISFHFKREIFIMYLVILTNDKFSLSTFPKV